MYCKTQNLLEYVSTVLASTGLAVAVGSATFVEPKNIEGIIAGSIAGAIGIAGCLYCLHCETKEEQREDRLRRK
ncbi:MAG TPA: hypothetical protein VMZ91_01380 [Candidatus Paceibacterota bacterium]|nr:hypothetical protein [Candidatus Paceibacterota bacterium]